MLPRWHVFWAFFGTLLIWLVFPETAWYNLFLFWFAAIFIDFDHYMCFVMNTGKIGIGESFKYHEALERKEKEERRREIRRRGDFHVFHTIEFHALVFAIGWFFFAPFLYIFLGMFFHSALDFINLVRFDRLYRREYLQVNWIKKSMYS